VGDGKPTMVETIAMENSSKLEGIEGKEGEKSFAK
jgi:hypothetical protein